MKKNRNRITLNEMLEQLTPIFKVYKLKPSRLKEFKQAQAIDKAINSKVSNLIEIAGIEKLKNMKNTTENNKLIAEFMMFETVGYLHLIPFDNTANDTYLPEHMKFHSSWDWLMPVVEKIENTFQKGTGDYCKVYISNYNDSSDMFYYCNIFGSEDTQFNGESRISKIISVYKAVVEFIKWYNENK